MCELNHCATGPALGFFFYTQRCHQDTLLNLVGSPPKRNSALDIWHNKNPSPIRLYLSVYIFIQPSLYLSNVAIPPPASTIHPSTQLSISLLFCVLTDSRHGPPEAQNTLYGQFLSLSFFFFFKVFLSFFILVRKIGPKLISGANIPFFAWGGLSLS